MRFLYATCFVASPAFADDCKPAADHSALANEIIFDLRDARSTLEARLLTSQLEKLWADAPNARAQDLLDSGMRKLSEGDNYAARDYFDQLIAYCPDYAEGYHQRAYANYRLQWLDSAVDDLKRTLELNQRHIGALSLKGLALMRLGRMDEGQDFLRAAVTLNPWLKERDLLIEELGTLI